MSKTPKSNKKMPERELAKPIQGKMPDKESPNTGKAFPPFQPTKKSPNRPAEIKVKKNNATTKRSMPLAEKNNLKNAAGKNK